MMTTGDIGEVTVDGKDVEVETKFVSNRRSGDLDNDKTREKEDQRFRVVVLEKSSLLRVSWMEKKTNISIIENIKPEWTLESRVTKAALSYFGHVVRAGGMEGDHPLHIILL